MIIHVAGDIQHFKNQIPYLQKIAQIAQQNDCTITQDQIDVASGIDEGLQAMNDADVVIVEATGYSFEHGLQVAAALQQKKPTLVVSQDAAIKNDLGTLKNRLLTIASYQTEEELTKITIKFIHTNTISTKDLRFNMFIDRPIYNYLRSQSYETGKNKSEIIRDLINHEINKES